LVGTKGRNLSLGASASNFEGDLDQQARKDILRRTGRFDRGGRSFGRSSYIAQLGAQPRRSLQSPAPSRTKKGIKTKKKLMDPADRGTFMRGILVDRQETSNIIRMSTPSKKTERRKVKRDTQRGQGPTFLVCRCIQKANKAKTELNR